MPAHLIRRIPVELTPEELSTVLESLQSTATEHFSHARRTKIPSLRAVSLAKANKVRDLADSLTRRQFVETVIGPDPRD